MIVDDIADVTELLREMDPRIELEPACNPRSMYDLLSGVSERVRRPKIEMGLRCGHGHIDAQMGGFRRGHVTVLGAGTSWGKSSFAVQVVDLASCAGRRALIVSGEDREGLYANRFMARRTGIAASALRDGDVGAHDREIVAAVSGAHAERTPVFLDMVGRNVDAACVALRRVCEEHAIELVIVDYIQAFRWTKKTDDRRNEVTYVARSFSDVIKSANAAGLMLSQLKRLEKATQRPTLNDLKESGDIENMAEHVLMGWIQQNDRETTRWISIEKNKDGPRDTEAVLMRFTDRTACFGEVSLEEFNREGNRH